MKKVTRRDVFGLAVSSAFLPALSKAGDSASAAPFGIAIPRFVEAAVARTLARFREWKGGDETVVFPLVSDLHAEGKPVLKVPGTKEDGRDPKLHVLYARMAVEAFGADFLADLGDIGMDIWRWREDAKPRCPSWEEHTKPRMEQQYRLYEGLRVPVLFVPGNHDRGNPRHRTISTAEWGAAFNVRQRAERLGATALSPNGDYGHLDLAAKRTRIAFLDTSEENPVGKSVSPEQEAWLERTVAATPPGWRLVVLSHYCLHRNLGRWVPMTLERAGAGVNPFARVCEILERFAAARGTPVLAFSGDSHFDAEVSENGVVYVITQSYGWIPWQCLPPEARYEDFDFAEDLLVDMVALKPATGEARVFRIGVGGEAADRDLAADANRGTVTMSCLDGVAHLTIPAVKRRVAFTVKSGEAVARDLTAESRDGMRFVWIDNRGGEVTAEQLAFLKREIAGREPVALVVSVPLYVPGLPVSVATGAHVDWRMPKGHPEYGRRPWPGGGHSYDTFEFRRRVFHAPRMAGVFCADGEKAFAAMAEGVVECVATAATGQKVVVNGW